MVELETGIVLLSSCFLVFLRSKNTSKGFGFVFCVLFFWILGDLRYEIGDEIVFIAGI